MFNSCLNVHPNIFRAFSCISLHFGISVLKILTNCSLLKHVHITLMILNVIREANISMYLICYFLAFLSPCLGQNVIFLGLNVLSMLIFMYVTFSSKHVIKMIACLLHKFDFQKYPSNSIYVTSNK